MSLLVLIYAGSLALAFIAWYFCLLIPNRWVRGLLRALVIAVLCVPGVLIGHGVAPGPMLFALYVQPFIFNFVIILIAWTIASAIILCVPALRNDPGRWPPSLRQIFLDYHLGKFILFGFLAASVMYSLIYSGHRDSILIGTLKYVLFFSAAVVNLTLCHWAARVKQAHPLVTPLFFTAPVLLVSPGNVALMWYGAGAIGGLTGSSQRRIAAWIALGVFGLLSVNSMFRIYLAATAAPHVTIGGGVSGNAAMAALFAVLAIVPWWLFRRSAQGSPESARSPENQAGDQRL